MLGFVIKKPIIMEIDVYEIVVIGGGAISLGALLQLQREKLSKEQIRKCLFITHASNELKNCPISNLHPKIAVEARKQDLSISLLKEWIHKDDGPRSKLRPPIFSLGTMGGLANFWGQQVWAVPESGHWPVTEFTDYDEYFSICNTIINSFTDQIDIRHQQQIFKEASRPLGCSTKPFLLRNHRDGEDVVASDISSMRGALIRVLNELAIPTLNLEVKKLRNQKRHVVVEFTDGSTIETKRVALGVGALGCGKVLLESFGLSEFIFDDHTPYTGLAFGYKHVSQKNIQLNSGLRAHFNVETFLCSSGDRYFASAYNLRYFDLSLLVSLLTGRVHPWLVNKQLPEFFDNLPAAIQCWTENTKSSICFSMEDYTLSCHRRDLGEGDEGYSSFKKLMREKNFRYKENSVTPAGQGFHYHNLRFNDKLTNSISVNEILTEFSDRVCVLGLESLPAIDVFPPTLTGMAVASKKFSNILAKDVL